MLIFLGARALATILPQAVNGNVHGEMVIHLLSVVKRNTVVLPVAVLSMHNPRESSLAGASIHFHRISMSGYS